MKCLFILAVLWFGACASSSGPSYVDETYTTAEIVAAAVDELGRNGDRDADAALIAAGSEAAPQVKSLLGSPNPEVRERARIILASVEPGRSISPSEQVDLVLTEVLRESGAPHAALLAAERIRSLGPAGRARLEERARRDDEGGALARRLLPLVAETP